MICLFEIYCLISEEFFGINNVNSLSLFHQILSNLFVGREVTAVSGEKSEKPMRRIGANQKVSHRLVVVKILAADRTFEFDPQTILPYGCLIVLAAFNC